MACARAHRVDNSQFVVPQYQCGQTELEYKSQWNESQYKCDKKIAVFIIPRTPYVCTSRSLSCREYDRRFVKHLTEEKPIENGRIWFDTELN